MNRQEQKLESMENDLSSKKDIIDTDFCLQIAQRVGLEKAENGSNFVMCPISIHAMLNLVAVGSTGKTLEQFLFFLKAKTLNDLKEASSRLVTLMSNHDSGGPVLSLANSVWVDKRFPLKPNFRDFVCGVHGAEAKDVDFQTKADQVTEEINSWAEKATDGIIKNALGPGYINSSTKLILVNALNFKGVWDGVFKSSQIRNGEFLLLNGDKVEVPYMTQHSEDHLFGAFNDFKVLKLPYKSDQDNKKFAMYFFLPDKKNGLKNLMNKLISNAGFLNQDYELRFTLLGAFMIPKFEISCGFETSKTMQELGLVFPFWSGRELSEIFADELYVSNKTQTGCVEINEERTVAAACLRCRGDGSGVSMLPTFVADHPFMFMVREETSRMVLFIGSVLNPSSET